VCLFVQDLFILVISSLLPSSQTTRSSGRNETDLLTVGCIPSHGGGVSHMLVITSSVRVIDGIHGNSSDLWPHVPLGLVLVVSNSCLEEGFVDPSSSSNKTNHGTSTGWNALLGSRGQSDPADRLIRVVTDDGGVVSRASSKDSPISYFCLHIANDGSLRHFTQQQRQQRIGARERHKQTQFRMCGSDVL